MSIYFLDDDLYPSDENPTPKEDREKMARTAEIIEDGLKKSKHKLPDSSKIDILAEDIFRRITTHYGTLNQDL